MDTNALTIVDSQPPGMDVERPDPIDVAIATWVHNKKLRSGSVRTEQTYQKTIEDFRAHLQAHGLDLDHPKRTIQPYLQAWAAHNAGESGATFNQRLAVVSSFYQFARRREMLYTWEAEANGGRRRVLVDNPAEIERAKVDPYGKAKALKPEEVAERLARIDQSTLLGMRDYALLCVAFMTGRRRSELAGLQWQHVSIWKETVEGYDTPQEIVTITWPRAKGNKHPADTLEPEVSAALLLYLRAAYHPRLKQIPPEAPLWVALDHAKGAAKRSATAGLSGYGISARYKELLGTGKVHVSRHSFALGMKKAGAPIETIQERLQHADLDTTAGYLPKLEGNINPFAPKLAAAFGLRKGRLKS